MLSMATTCSLVLSVFKGVNLACLQLGGNTTGLTQLFIVVYALLSQGWMPEK